MFWRVGESLQLFISRLTRMGSHNELFALFSLLIALVFLVFVPHVNTSAVVLSITLIAVSLIIRGTKEQKSSSVLPASSLQAELDEIRLEITNKIESVRQEVIITKKELLKEIQTQSLDICALIHANSIQRTSHNNEDLLNEEEVQKDEFQDQIDQMALLRSRNETLQRKIKEEDHLGSINMIMKEIEALSCGYEANKTILLDKEPIKGYYESSDEESESLDNIVELCEEKNENEAFYPEIEEKPILLPVLSIEETPKENLISETSYATKTEPIEPLSLEFELTSPTDNWNEDEENADTSQQYTRLSVDDMDIERKIMRRSSSDSLLNQPRRASLAPTGFGTHGLSFTKAVESPKNRPFLGAQHRTATKKQLQELNRKTLETLAEKLEQPTKSERRKIKLLTSHERRAIDRIGLNTSRVLTSRKEELMFPITVLLPYGGKTSIQCFQDAPQLEIMEMLWNKLERSTQQAPTASANAFIAITDVIFKTDFLVMEALLASVEQEKKDHITHLFIEITIAQKQSVFFIKQAIDEQVDHHHGNDINSLFRGNGFATMLVASFFRYHLYQFYLQRIIPMIQKRFTHPIFKEEEAGTDDQERAIIQATVDLFQLVESSVNDIPPIMKGICSYLSTSVRRKFPGQESKILAGFFFLRLVCPLIINGPTEIEPESQRSLLKVTRYLQLIANHSSITTSHCPFPNLLLEVQPRAVQFYEFFTTKDHPCEEFARAELTELSGISARETVAKLYSLLVQTLRRVLLYIQNEIPESDSIIEKIISIAGYPLGAIDTYQIKVTNTNYYLSHASFRPLIDTPGLREFFMLKDGLYSPSLSLISREDNEERAVAKQISCILDCIALPSWNFGSLEVNQFREAVIVPLKYLVFPSRPVMAAVQKADVASLSLIPRTFLIRIHVADEMSKSFFVSGSMTVGDILVQIIQKAKSFLSTSTHMEELLFRYSECEQYIVDQSIQLADLVLLRERLLRKKSIELILMQKTNVPGFLNFKTPLPSISYSLIEDNMVASAQLSKSMLVHSSRNANFIPLYDAVDRKVRFSITINGIENIASVCTKVSGNDYCAIQVDLFHSGISLCPPVRTTPSALNDLQWDEIVEFDISYRKIPYESRLCFTLLLIHPKHSSFQPLAWVASRIYDCNHCISSNQYIEAGMWISKEYGNPIGTCEANSSTLDQKPILSFTFSEFTSKYVQLPRVLPRPSPLSLPGDLQELDESTEKILHRLIQKDALYQPKEEELKLLWNARCFYSDCSRGLSKFLLSVKWSNFFVVEEAYRLLSIWSPPTNPIDILELLGPKYEDERVRQYAVDTLALIDDDELILYLLQLVQVLKHEKQHKSPLALFLVHRSLRNFTIGQKVFWSLFVEIDCPAISERFGLILEAFLYGTGSVHREDLLQQREFISSMKKIAHLVSDEKTKTGKNTRLRSLLCSTPVVNPLRVPYDHTLVAGCLRVEKCKAMDSAQAPLFLAFDNANQSKEHVYTLYKSGDDLRQDVLTLQMISIMDKLWKEENMDLMLSPYHCISTGKEEGLIEIVTDSVTTADIHKKAAGIRGAFSEQCMANFLHEANTDPKEYDNATQIFMRSCAGYCVATYVLGIGDRHNDNIMLCRTGHLFHIDFGHFLGNWQTWKGLKRDRNPFVFTPEFAFVMGGKSSPDYESFCDLTCSAFLILRKHAHLFINLFLLMVSTGMPELSSADNLMYIRDAFVLDKTDEQAATYFRSLISKSLNSTATRLNNAVHILVHPT